MPHLRQRGIDMGFVNDDALVTVLARILETFATKEELEAIEAGGVTVDAALSSTSTNPVQNKVVKAALDGKASSNHSHAAGDITSGTLSVARGGTGKSSWTTNRLIYPTSGTVLGQLAFPTTAGSFLRQGTSGAPYWSTPANVLSAIEALPLAGGTVTGKTSFNLGARLNALYTLGDIVVFDYNETGNALAYGYGSYDNNMNTIIYGGTVSITPKGGADINLGGQY